MGQKVHPKGLRLGILTTWDSRWIFGNKKVYKEALLNDIAIRTGITKRFSFADVVQVEIERAINKIGLIIHAVKPGMIIGRGGKGLEEIKRFAQDVIGRKTVKKQKTKIDIKIEPVKKPYLNAQFVAHDIAGKLVRQLPHRIIIHHSMDRVMEAGAKGVKIQLGGRIAGAAISRREKYYEGTVPMSTVREDIDFARFPALTRSGYIGVKVWIARKNF
ncbi:MAG TPA: 30S ribosomal protein S3 [Patescibacteria group bacterium]|nr:30S ribosomal protein S3 [Patescibacteria group bacterium]